MPSNTNYVCFRCRTAQRRPKRHTGEVYCPQCGQACTYLSYKLAIPPKRHPKAWRALQKRMGAFSREQSRFSEEQWDFLRRETLAEIARLKRQLKTLVNSDVEHSRLSRQLTEARQRLAQTRHYLYVRRTLRPSGQSR